MPTAGVPGGCSHWVVTLARFSPATSLRSVEYRHKYPPCAEMERMYAAPLMRAALAAAGVSAAGADTLRKAPTARINRFMRPT